MVDEINSLHAAPRLQTKRLVSMESTHDVERVISSDALNAIDNMKLEIQMGLELMAEIQARLENAYRTLSPSK